MVLNGRDNMVSLIAGLDTMSGPWDQATVVGLKDVGVESIKCRRAVFKTDGPVKT